MKISYSWLKNYLNCDLDSQTVAKVLTGTGLEVETAENFESIKGGLKGLVVGEVKTCVPHPDSDHMHVTTVDVGQENLLNIVCGAPNVAAGEKVIVATIGTVLYDGDKSFTIKKSKLRGVVSEGMICAEDEIGVGTSHDGIIVLPSDTKVGTPAAEIFKVENDTVYEIGITPNRIDGASHIGCARDIYAFLKTSGAVPGVKLVLPDTSNFKVDNHNLEIPVEVVSTDRCLRYSGVTISGITIKESPDWLKKRVESVGIRSINNVVDITNFILFEYGQPLHSFDADEIKGNKVIVKTLDEGTSFVTLDEQERKLSSEDLMICNAEEPMCIGGVFGGLKSGIKDTTKNVFLESACFSPVSVRKTAKRHNLHTDAAFHFERGVDPETTVEILKRAALLIKEVAGGEISSEIVDIYPKKQEKAVIKLEFSYLDRIIGKKIEVSKVKEILTALDFEIAEETSDYLTVKAPTYRVDVKENCDVAEEILRIYGYDNVEIPLEVHSVLSYSAKPNKEKLTNKVSDYLSDTGFCEAMCNSLTQSAYYDGLENFKPENLVLVKNPLSAQMNSMRMTLLFGALESVAFNINQKNDSIKLYEFGNIWSLGLKKSDNKGRLADYADENHLMITLSGNFQPVNWSTLEIKSNFFVLKTTVNNVLERIGYNAENLQKRETEMSDIFSYGMTYCMGKEKLVEFGSISRKLLKKFDIDQDVFYAEFNWSNVLRFLPKETKYKAVSKYPEVKRDFALLLDKKVKFEEIKQLAKKTEKQYLKDVNIFDIYVNDEKLGKDKKSYAVSFTFQDPEATFTDARIDKIMSNLRAVFEKNLGAQIR
ncbi:MAG: phenylalanine--tRNA ligase subunit beta [Bacteroidales bacterium]|nr:phenylalanine--tRNA ligase subunit beta [Bacteroidales bacterium]